MDEKNEGGALAFKALPVTAQIKPGSYVVFAYLKGGVWRYDRG